MRAAAALAVVLMAGACGSEPAGSRYASCIDLDEVEDRALPDPLRLPEGARVTQIEEKKGFVVLNAVADASIDDIYEPTEQELEEAGFEIINRDYEGFEAELFFVSREESAGVARMRIGPCPDQVTLTLLYDPLETEQGKKALRDIRKDAARSQDG